MSVNFINQRSSTKRSRVGEQKKYNSKKCLDLTYASNHYGNKLKTHHIEKMINKHNNSLETDKDHPEFLYLIFQVRSYCIVLAYFPSGSKYHKLFSNYYESPGWNAEMDDNEREILELFDQAAIDLLKNYRNTELFNSVEKKFAAYRHQRWLNSLKKE
jgi:hypothetical protein